jgi:opacity protein-like surface antigen
MRVKWIILSAICLCAWLCQSRAGAAGADELVQSLDNEVSFTDSRRWAFGLTGTGIVDVTNRDTAMAGPRVSLGYYFLDNLSGNIELTGLTVQQDNVATAAQVAIVLRHHFIEIGRGSLFFDVGGGLFRGSERVPANGTHNNFTFETGFGATYPVADGVHLIAGIRYFHLSNAMRKGDVRNPSINGPEGYVGLIFMF